MAEVQVISPDGRAGTADEADLPFLTERGFRVESTDEAVSRLERERAGSGFGQLQAGVEGFVRGYTGGLGDVVTIDPEGTRLRKEENPVTSFVTEVAGTLMPTGVGGAAARAGVAVGERIGARVGTSIAGKAVATAAKVGTESAIQGAGQGVSAAALAKDKQAPEDIVATIGSHALYAGAFGAGLGAAGSLIASGAKAGRANAAAAADEAAAARDGTEADVILDRLARRPGGPPVDKAIRRDLADLRARAAEEAKTAPLARVKPEEMKEWKSGLDASLDRFSKDELPRLASEGRQAAARAKKIGAGAIEEYKVGAADDDLEAKLRASLKKGTPKPGTQEVEAAQVVAVQGDPRAIKQAADEFEAVRESWEQWFQVKKHGAADYRVGMSRAELQKAISHPDGYALHKKYREARLNLLQTLNPSKPFTDLAPFESAKAFDLASKISDAEGRMAQAAADVPDFGPYQAAIDDLSRALTEGKDPRVIAKGMADEAARVGIAPPSRDDLLAYANVIGKPVGPGLTPGGSLEAELTIGFYENAAKAAEKVRAEARQASVRKFGAAGAVLGGVAGFVKGGPLGAFFGSERGGFAGRFIGHLWNGRDRVRGRIRGGLSHFMGKIARASDVLQSGIGKGAERFQRVAPALASQVVARIAYAPDAKKASGKAAVKARIDELTQVMQDPQAARTRLHQSLSWLWQNDPELADKVETLAWTRLEFLAGKVPQRPPLDPFRHDFWPLADEEAERAARYMAAAEDPAGRAVEEMNAGRLSPETVETLKALAPETYSWMRAEIVRSIPELRQELPYAKRLTLGTLFEAPVDALQDPAVLVALQEEIEMDAAEKEASGVSKTDIGSVRLKAPEPTPAQSQAAGSP